MDDLSRTIADMPALNSGQFKAPDPGRLTGPVSRHKPRILLLHGSLRQRSYSRFLADEAERLLIAMGCETRRFDPATLPLPDSLIPRILRSRNCAHCPFGRKVRSGAVRNGTEPCPA